MTVRREGACWRNCRPSTRPRRRIDLLDRLTSATGASLNQSWTYDANGNRLTEAGAQPSTYTVSSTNNRITSITGSLTRSYSYDAAGNTTGYDGATFIYDDAGRMVSASKTGVTTTYSLNALGQRVKKTTGGASTHFVYDEAGHLVGEHDSAGNLIQETVWFGDIPVATLRPNGSSGVDVFYVHSDHLSTPRKVTRPSDNAIVWRWDSDPFGTTVPNQNPSGIGTFVYNLRFPGQYADSETGLNYNYFRDYDPATGRYVQSDPSGLSGGINTYAYVGGNPIMHADPRGLDAAAPAIPRPMPIPGIKDSCMDRVIAERLINELVKAQRMLDSVEVLAREVDDPSEQERIRTAIMQASGMLYTEVMFGIISEYPDLNPYPTRHDPKT